MGLLRLDCWSLLRDIIVLFALLHNDAEAGGDSTQVLVEGMSKTFTCTAGYPPAYMSIFRDEQELGTIRQSDCQSVSDAPIDTVRYSYACPESTKLTWTIKNVTREYDNSSWKCMLIDRNNYSIYTNRIILQVQVVPKLPVITGANGNADGELEIWVSKGHEMTLNCVASDGHSPQTVIWYRDTTDSEPLVSTSEGVTEINGVFTAHSKYRITPSDADDGVTYVCQSSYDSAPQIEAHQSVRLLLAVPPEKPEIQNVIKDGTGNIIWGQQDKEMTLECESKHGRPLQKVQWFKDTTDSDALISEDSVNVDSDGLFTVWSRFTINPTHADDKTTYICQSSYDDTVPVHASQATVQLYLAVHPKVPEITNATKSESDTGTTSGLTIRGYVGSEITLECVSREGFPRQTINWYRATADTEPLASEESVSESTGGVFTIWRRYTFTPTQAHNNTMFICQSSSRVMVDLSQTSVQLSLESEQTGEMNVVDALHGSGNAVVGDGAVRCVTMLIAAGLLLLSSM